MPMTAEERAHLLHLLEDSKQEYLSCIDDVSETQWNWKPAPETWSIGQKAEHILLAEISLFGVVQRIIEAPTNPDWETKTAGKTELLQRLLPETTRKAVAPEHIHPQGLCKSEVVGRFQELRVNIVNFASETRVALKEHTAEHPFPIFGTLNAYQFLLYIPLHTVRHNRQIAVLKAMPSYPT